MNNGAKAMQRKAESRKADKTAEGKRVKAYELEQRADSIMRIAAMLGMDGQQALRTGGGAAAGV